jgi:hypothetical protein
MFCFKFRIEVSLSERLDSQVERLIRVLEANSVPAPDTRALEAILPLAKAKTQALADAIAAAAK